MTVKIIFFTWKFSSYSIKLQNRKIKRNSSLVLQKFLTVDIKVLLFAEMVATEQRAGNTGKTNVGRSLKYLETTNVRQTLYPRLLRMRWSPDRQKT